MDQSDEILAKQLQTEFDKEERSYLRQVEHDQKLAQQVVALRDNDPSPSHCSAHLISDSDSNSEDLLITHTNRPPGLPSSIQYISDDDKIHAPIKRKRSCSSRDSDETLDPNDDWDLFVERSEAKAITSWNRTRHPMHVDHQCEFGESRISGLDHSKVHDSVTDTCTVSDDSDVTIDYSPHIETVSATESDSDNMHRNSSNQSKHVSQTNPSALMKKISVDHVISDSDPDDDISLSHVPKITKSVTAKDNKTTPTKITKPKNTTSKTITHTALKNSSQSSSKNTPPRVPKNTTSSTTHTPTKETNPKYTIPKHQHTSPKVSNLKHSSSTSSGKSRKRHNLSDSADSDDTVDLGSHGNKDDQSNSSHSNNKHGNPGNRSKDDRPLCSYGSKCYRKNPSHLREFRHVDTSSPESAPAKKRRLIDTATVPMVPGDDKSGGSRSPSVAPKLTAVGRTSSHNVTAENGGVFGFMLTKVSGIEPQHNKWLSVDIKDILSPSMGKLVRSAQFNYMTDIAWLVQQYPTQHRTKPVLIVHGCERAQKAAMVREAKPYSHVELCQAKLEIPYGTHHTKMMLLMYDNGLRIVIHTANLIQQDWYQKTQGVWMSPLFSKLPSASSTAGDSVTHFKRDLLQYIDAYKSPQLTDWMMILRQHDMSTAKVHLVGSVPGRHMGEKKSAYGHLKLKKILQMSGPTKLHAQSWPVIGQFSSIGSLGANKDVWVCGEWLESLSTTRGSASMPGPNRAQVHLIYPSKDNVRVSLEGYPAGASLPYSINVAKKQIWLQHLLFQWKSEFRGRSRASPHIKTYMRVSPDWRNIAWFMVTSANLSKAAWGTLEKSRSQLMIRSYELGVLYLPENFGPASSFSVMSRSDDPVICSDTKQLRFPLPYDMPPVQYSKEDRPWVWDIPHTEKPDSKGNMWCPS